MHDYDNDTLLQPLQTPPTDSLVKFLPGYNRPLFTDMNFVAMAV